jgi:hypothetical protein
MRILIKILLIFVLFVIATPLFVLVKDAGPLKLVFLAGLVAGIAAIWKYNPDASSSEIDNQHLDKS